MKHVFSISVPIGAYHPFLGPCLRSLFCQEAPVQVAFLDASGDDRVREIADIYADKLAYRRHGPDAGQSAAIVEGWENTTGDVLGWLNADDLLFPGAIQRACSAFEQGPEIDVVYGHSTILNENFETTGYHWAVEPNIERILEAGVISQPSCFLHRAAYDKVGGLNQDLHYTMDWDLWIRLYRSGAQFRFIDAPLSMVLWGDETKTSSFNARRRTELRRLIEANAPAGRQRKVFLSFAIHNLLDRVPFQIAKRFITRRIVRGRQTVFGIGGEGQIADGAVVSLAHYHNAPAAGVYFAIDAPAQISAVKLEDRGDCKIERSRNGIKVIPPAPLESGEKFNFSFSLRPEGRQPLFKSAKFVQTALQVICDFDSKARFSDTSLSVFPYMESLTV